MIAAARARAERAARRRRFICADAQDHVFEPASFDTIISRFGVMFFDDSGPRLCEPAPGRERTTPRCGVIAWRSARRIRS